MCKVSKESVTDFSILYKEMYAKDNASLQGQCQFTTDSYEIAEKLIFGGGVFFT